MTATASSEPVRFDPKDRPLRRDVGRLGALLGDLLRELAPAGVYEAVETARLAARRRRKGEGAAGDELAALLGELAPEAWLEVVRAFSAYFGAVNTAEQVHRIRRRLDYSREDLPQPSSLRAAAMELARRGTSAAEVERALATLLVGPVFTAHPTEPVRRTLLKKDQRLARALVERDREEAHDPVAVARLDEAIALELASAWQTEEELPERPTVAEEVEHVLFFLSDVLYQVVPAVHEELERALARAYGRPFRVERPVVRFASWVGGDVDGNPNVGADTIRATLGRHLELVLRRYREELRATPSSSATSGRACSRASRTRTRAPWRPCSTCSRSATCSSATRPCAARSACATPTSTPSTSCRSTACAAGARATARTPPSSASWCSPCGASRAGCETRAD